MSDLVVFTKQGKELTMTGRNTLEAIKARRGLDRYQFSSKQTRMKLMFDATGSMAPFWQETKDGIEKFVDRVTYLVPDISVSLLAYRDYDYSDKMIQKLPFTRDIKSMKDFIGNIECISGQNTPEAVEMALELLLTDETASFGVLAGDAPPHGVVDEMVNNKDWRDIANQLARQQKKVYTVLVGNCEIAESVFRQIAEVTGGKFFRLEQIDELVDILSAATARHVGRLSMLSALIKKEQGGVLTGRQQEMLRE